METFSKDDRKILNEIPEFKRFEAWLEVKLKGIENKILSTDPEQTKQLIVYQAQRSVYKTILNAKENE
jgi:hypothetical protein